jgi:hypothetical protein
MYVHAKTSLNSFNSCSTSSTLFISSYALIFTMCGSTLVSRLSFINCWFLVNVHPIICNSMLWYLLEFHPLQHSLVNYSTFPDTPCPVELLLTHIYC